MGRCLLVIAFCLIVSACGHPPEPPAAAASAPVLQGTYRAANGETLSFSPGGTVLGTVGRGTFVVDGSAVSLSIAGTTIPGERSGPDTLVFHPADRPVATFYRLGSAAAQTAQAAPTSAAAAPKPTPDTAKALDQYTVVADAATLRAIAYAFAMPAPDDEQLLTLLPPPPNSDAFARHDYLIQHRGELDTRLQGIRAQRYYRVDVVGSPHPGAAPGGIAWDWNGVQLDGYDFDAHAFPMPCPQTSSVKDEPPSPAAAADVVHFAMRADGQRCALPVADVSAAKAVEAARASAMPTLPARASLFFFVTGSRASFPNVVDAVLTHIDVVVLDTKDGTSELAHSSSDFH